MLTFHFLLLLIYVGIEQEFFARAEKKVASNLYTSCSNALWLRSGWKQLCDGSRARISIRLSIQSHLASPEVNFQRETQIQKITGAFAKNV
jgi:hypothetical protein